MTQPAEGLPAPTDRTQRHLTAMAQQHRRAAAICTVPHIAAQMLLIAAVFALGWVMVAAYIRDLGWQVAVDGPLTREHRSLSVTEVITHQTASGLSPLTLLMSMAGLFVAGAMVTSVYRDTVGTRVAARQRSSAPASAGGCASSAAACGAATGRSASSAAACGAATGGSASATTTATTAGRGGAISPSSARGSAAAGGSSSITPDGPSDSSSTTEKE